jgi:hypothetical protein
MAELIISYNGKNLQYLINTVVKIEQQEKVINDILKYFPPDVEFEINELY